MCLVAETVGPDWWILWVYFVFTNLFSFYAAFESQEAFSKIPIGFIPLGSRNSLSQSLHVVTDDKVK